MWDWFWKLGMEPESWDKATQRWYGDWIWKALGVIVRWLDLRTMPFLTLMLVVAALACMFPSARHYAIKISRWSVFAFLIITVLALTLP